MAADAYTNRRENLRKLIQQWNGPGPLAKKLGYSNASFMVQMAGPNPTREVSERTARKIERALDLPLHWLDAHDDGTTTAPAVDMGLVTEVVTIVTRSCQEAGMTLPPDKFADLVNIVYADAIATGGSPRLNYLAQILRLMKN